MSKVTKLPDHYAKKKFGDLICDLWDLFPVYQELYTLNCGNDEALSKEFKLALDLETKCLRARISDIFNELSRLAFRREEYE